MIENTLHFRVVEDKDWANILFVLTFTVIAITKSAFEIRFSEFVKLIYSNKYTKVYKDGIHLKSSFTISLFFIQLVSFSFFIQILLSSFGYTTKTDWIFYIKIFTFLLYFILAKFLIEKIIANTFNIDNFIDQFNLQKVIFKNYIGLFLLPINIIIFYNESISRKFILITAFIILIINILVYFISIKNHRNIIFSKLFYFILYLCGLEIGPYYFVYYWFTKGIA